MQERSEAMTTAPPMSPFDCLYACAELQDRWFEWQRALCQPIADAQAACMRQWLEQCSWSGPDVVLARGCEQLA